MTQFFLKGESSTIIIFSQYILNRFKRVRLPLIAYIVIH